MFSSIPVTLYFIIFYNSVSILDFNKVTVTSLVSFTKNFTFSQKFLFPLELYFSFVELWLNIYYLIGVLYNIIIFLTYLVSYIDSLEVGWFSIVLRKMKTNYLILFFFSSFYFSKLVIIVCLTFDVVLMRFYTFNK